MKTRGWTGRLTGSAALLAAFLAAVIWAKLKLVGHMPRTAYAEPELVIPGE